MFGADDVKTIVDIGLGAVSLMLWFRQGSVNKAQTEAIQDLTKMCKSHDDRLEVLESIPLNKWGSRPRPRVKRG